MKTIKLPYKTNGNLISIFKQYSSVVRYSYNRFLDDKNEKEIRKLTKSLNNASIEIARRGFEWKINKSKNSFYPEFNLKNSIQHQWKEMGIELVEDWKKLYLIAKNLKLKYRVSLDNASKMHKMSVFRLNQSKKSCINLYNFS